MAQTGESEQTLWTLLRSHRERAELAREMASRTGSASIAEDLRRRADGYDEDAETIRRMLSDISRMADTEDQPG